MRSLYCPLNNGAMPQVCAAPYACKFFHSRAALPVRFLPRLPWGAQALPDATKARLAPCLAELNITLVFLFPPCILSAHHHAAQSQSPIAPFAIPLPRLCSRQVAAFRRSFAHDPWVHLLSESPFTAV